MIINYIAEKGLTSQYSFIDAMDYLKEIRVDKLDGKWTLTKITEQTKKMCDDLAIIIQGPEKDGES